MLLRRCLLLTLSVAVVLVQVQASVQPGNPLTLCSAYTIEDDIAPPYNYAYNNLYVGGSNQFGPNLLIYNPGNLLMSGDASVEGPYLKVADTSGFWVPGGELTYNVNLYKEKARTTLVGTGVITTRLTPMMMPIPLSVSPDLDPASSTIITYVGGYLHIKTTMLSTSPGYGANTAVAKWVNYRNLDKYIYFRPEDSMPGAFPHPLMNRLMSNNETSLFGATYGPRLAAGLTNDKLLMIMWGSDGWDGNNYVNHATGFDLLLRLTCDPSRSIDPIPPPPSFPCPDGSCVNSFLASYPGCQAPVSNPIVAASPNSNCVSLVFSESTTPSPCPRG